MMTTLLHPSLGSLKPHADGELDDPRVAAHLTRCEACRQQVAALRGLRETLRRLPTTEPSGDLLARALASRAAGMRAILETQAEPAGRRASTRWLAIAATVVLVVGAALVVRRQEDRPSTTSQAPSLDDLTRAMFPWPAMASAQQPDQTPLGPRYPLVPGLEGARLYAGEWSYQVRVSIDGVMTSEHGRRTYTLSDATFGSLPAWRITTVWSKGFVDSILVDKATLRPVRRLFQTTRVRMVQEYSADSLRQTVERLVPPLHGGRSALALPNAPIIDWLAIKPALQVLPLAPSWRGSVYVVSSAIRGLEPLNLRVVGHETITVPAGTFDCWKVKADGPDYVENGFIWVSRRDHWVIKTRSRPAYDMEFEELLIAYGPQGPT